MDSFNTVMVLNNIFIILVFYVMALLYLEKYGEELAALATLFWSSFAGFGWSHFLIQKVNNPYVHTSQLIMQSNVISYGDITWRRLFFHLPMETSLALVFAILYLLKQYDMTRNTLIPLMILLTAPLPLMHSYAMYLFFSMLICCTFTTSVKLRHQLRQLAFSMIISAVIAATLNYILFIKTSSKIPLNLYATLGYVLMSIIILIITELRRFIRGRRVVESKASRFSGINAIKINAISIILHLLLILYLASILMWISGNVTFSFSDLNRFGYVPWALYPVKLGILGIATILSIWIIINNRENASKELIFIISSFLLMILTSKLISIIQMRHSSVITLDPNTLFSTIITRYVLKFREERVFELYKVPIALISSIALSSYVLRQISFGKIKRRKLNYLITATMVSIILISGLASTFLGFQHYLEVIRTRQLDSSESNIINTLRNTIYNDTTKSIIISPQTHKSYLELTGAVPIVTEAIAAWKSRSPEQALFMIRYTKSSPTYIYLHKERDYSKLVEYKGNYLEHISSVAQTFLENEKVQVKVIRNWSIPTPQSSTALIVPYDAEMNMVLQPLLRETRKQYLILALFFTEDKRFIEFYQKPLSYNNIEFLAKGAFFNGFNSYIRMNATNIDFDEIFVEFAFQPLHLGDDRNQVIVSKFDWPERKSWEVAQRGRRIIFKISPDGETEYVVATGNILQPNTTYIVRCINDGLYMKIYVNNRLVASKEYRKGIYESKADIVIGAELHKNRPTGFANIVLKYIIVLNSVPKETEPIFYAYDLLSSIGLNYTAIVLGSKEIYNYRTLVLPYDDIITYETLIKLLNNTNADKVKHVIILNIDGNGPLLNLFGELTSKKFRTNKVFIVKEYFTLPTTIEVDVIRPYDDVKVESEYFNYLFSSPLIMMKSQNDLTLVYVNIYPLVKHDLIPNLKDVQYLFSTLKEYIEEYDESKVTPWFVESSLLFTALKARGSINIRSNTIIPINLPQNYVMEAEEYDEVEINCAKIIVQGGYGFYTRIIVVNPLIKMIDFENNYSITLNIRGNAAFLVRQPKLSISGEVVFEKFYMLHPSIVPTDGRKTTFMGNITLFIYSSDEYIVALPYKLNSTAVIKYEKPLMKYDELSALPRLVPYLIITIVMFVSFLLALLLIRNQLIIQEPSSIPSLKSEDTPS